MQRILTILKRTIRAMTPNPYALVVSGLCLTVAMLLVHLAYATTPNPGHPWTDIGNGTFQVANTQTAIRTFTFPDADATVLTANSLVTVAQGGTGSSTLTANGILYGNSTSAILATPPAANSVLATNGSNVPALTQTLPSAVQTNITSLGAVTAGSIASGFGSINIGSNIFTGNGSGLTTLNASNVTSGTLAVGQGGTGAGTFAANNVLLGNGTSAFQVVAPGTSGNILASNGTTWTAQASPDPMIYQPVGLYSNVLTAVTALTTGVTYFQYMGVAAKPYTSCNILANVTTAAVTITWSEVALFSGAPVLNGAASLTRLGFTSTAATYNSTGIKATSVSGTIPMGTQMWAAFGSSATTPFQLRGLMADNIQTGTFQTATVRPSTAASPQATVIAGAAVVPGWVTMKCQ